MIIGTESIEIESLDELISFTWYKPKVSKSITPGFTLAENLLNQKGGILYPKGMEFDDSKIEKLLRLKENNPDWKFKFSLERSENLVNTLQNRIFFDFNRLIDSKKSRHEYKRFIEKVANTIKLYKNDIINKEEMVITLYRIRFNEEKCNPDSRTFYYNHLINSALIVIGIFHQALKLGKKFSSEDIVKGTQVALFHGIGGANLIEMFYNKSFEEQKVRYEEGNKNSAGTASGIGLDSKVVEAIKYCNDFNQGKKDFIDKDDKASDYANVAITANIFDTKVSGLFGNAVLPKAAVDQLYMMATNKEIKKVYVDALAKNFKFGYLFDFYYEIEKLNKACPYGQYGRPYPMTGFKSPVIYVCKGRVTTCKHYVSSSKAVTIFKKVGDLEEGSYGRCEWISNLLIKFYDKFYEQIKEDTMTRDISKES